MRLSDKLVLLTSELKGKIHPKGVGLIFCTLDKFHTYCKFLHIKPTTENLVKHFSKIFFADHIYLSDLYLKEYGVTSYKQIGLAVDAAVNLGIFSYGPEDDLEDFNTDRSLIQDVRDLFSSFPKLIDLKLNDKYTCSSKS